MSKWFKSQNGHLYRLNSWDKIYVGCGNCIMGARYGPYPDIRLARYDTEPQATQAIQEFEHWIATDTSTVFQLGGNNNDSG